MDENKNPIQTEEINNVDKPFPEQVEEKKGRGKQSEGSTECSICQGTGLSDWAANKGQAKIVCENCEGSGEV